MSQNILPRLITNVVLNVSYNFTTKDPEWGMDELVLDVRILDSEK